MDQPPAGLLVCLFAQLNDSFGSVLQVAVLLLEQPIVTLNNGLLNLDDFAAGYSVECGRSGFQILVVEHCPDPVSSFRVRAAATTSILRPHSLNAFQAAAACRSPGSERRGSLVEGDPFGPVNRCPVQPKGSGAVFASPEMGDH